jgi:transcriptional regulator with XRE-family HTH domain
MSSGFFDAQRALGESIRDLREQKQWIQKDLAEHAKLPIRTIGRIERGEVDVRLSTLARIAKALNKTARDLLP